jgi:hypothetical protein
MTCTLLSFSQPQDQKDAAEHKLNIRRLQFASSECECLAKNSVSLPFGWQAFLFKLGAYLKQKRLLQILHAALATIGITISLRYISTGDVEGGQRL